MRTLRLSRFSTAIVLLVAVLVRSAPPVDTTLGNIVDTGYAKYLGNRTFPNTVAYLGIPYAEPPLVERRFRAPLPLNTKRIQQESGCKVVDTRNYPDFCIQGARGAGDHGGAGSEDCLKVNIYTPVGAKKGDNHPVLVYIHGGGYVHGNPRNWPFEHWVHQSPNVVIVSIYYRLSVFGFLAIPELSNTTNGNLNAGFLDQVEALKWVKAHISSFGGNPNQVTINGQSAGGSSVELHVVSPASKGLFHGAIAQSVYRTPVPTPEQQKPLFQFLASHAGCSSSNSTTEQLRCLRKASVSSIAMAQDLAMTDTFNTSFYNSFHPVIDPVTIPANPSDLLISGSFEHVPLMIGATSNDTAIGGSDVAAALQEAFPQLTPTDIDDFLQVYPLQDFDSPSQQLQVATGEVDIICAVEIMGGAFISNSEPVFAYRYNQPNPSQNTTAVKHAAESYMMFRGSVTGLNGTATFTSMSPIEVSFAEELIAYWLSFVRSFNPNTFKLERSPTWPQYQDFSRQRVVLQQDRQNNTEASGSFVELEFEEESARCAFVKSEIDKTQD